MFLKYLKNYSKLLSILLGLIGFIIIKSEYDQIVAHNDEVEYYSKLNTLLSRVRKINYFTKSVLDKVENYDTLPTLYVITICSVDILTEIADLNRLSNTLLLVPKVLWILVENKLEKSSRLVGFIAETELEIVHLNRNLAREFELMNAGIEWLRNNIKSSDGIVFFANTQGSYDLIPIYEHMIRSKTVTVWSVAFAKNSLYQRPVCVGNRIVSWNCAGNCHKNELIESSSFSIHFKLLISSKVFFENEFYLEFILKMVSINQLEPILIENCTKILAWNTKTRVPVIQFKSGLNKSYDPNLLSQL